MMKERLVSLVKCVGHTPPLRGIYGVRFFAEDKCGVWPLIKVTTKKKDVHIFFPRKREKKERFISSS